MHFPLPRALLFHGALVFEELRTVSRCRWRPWPSTWYGCGGRLAAPCVQHHCVPLLLGTCPQVPCRARVGHPGCQSLIARRSSSLATWSSEFMRSIVSERGAATVIAGIVVDGDAIPEMLSVGCFHPDVEGGHACRICACVMTPQPRCSAVSVFRLLNKCWHAVLVIFVQ